MRSLFVFSITVVMLLISIIVATTAQQETCEAAMVRFYSAAGEACLGGAGGQFCNGGSAPIAFPEAPELEALGGLAPVGGLDVFSTLPFSADGSAGGLAWGRMSETGVTGVLIGHASIQDMITPDSNFPDWTSMVVQTSPAAPECAAAPLSTVIFQSNNPFTGSRIVVNGVSVVLAGTVAVQTQGDETIFIVLEGRVELLANSGSQVLLAGQQASAAHLPEDYARAAGTPDAPLPLENSRVRNLPIQMLDRVVPLPQPGYVSTLGEVNVRSAPNVESGLVDVIPVGQALVVLGRDTSGEWYHVQLPNGSTGWMFGDLLQQNHGEISAVYEATPAPPQRIGRLGTQARVISAIGAVMRTAPHVGFGSLANLPDSQEVTLLARSPYSPWVKVDDGNGMIGWVPLNTLDTFAVVESLPVDYDVPPPPPPTVPPGSWGNAFPDPECYPNCGE